MAIVIRMNFPTGFDFAGWPELDHLQRRFCCLSKGYGPVHAAEASGMQSGK